MSKLNLGSLADLARILEEATNPESELREDRKENKPAAPPPSTRKVSAKAIDPKRKAWYDKRLKEQLPRTEAATAEEALVDGLEPSAPVVVVPKVPIARPIVGVKDLLASAQNAKPKSEGGKRPESWRRKPGDPIF